MNITFIMKNIQENPIFQDRWL